ncbi:MAG: TonB-dependent siderophore receptor [Opitutales bacterium]
MTPQTNLSRLFVSSLCLAASTASLIGQTSLLESDDDQSQGSVPYISSTQVTRSAIESESSAQSRAPSDDSDFSSMDDIFVLDDFVVTTEGDMGYFSANSVSATRTNALVKNTPISLTIINEQMLEDLSIFNDQDLDRATASVSQDPDGFSLNQLRIRGFRSLTQRYDLFWREIDRDGYNIQRIDIVKGANSLMYGQADPGGQINSVPKMAQFNESFGVVKGTMGTNDFRRGEIDFNHVFNDKFAARVMGLDFSRDLDQLYEFVDQQGATLELNYRPTRKTQFRAHVEHVNVEQNLAPNMFFSTGGDARFAPNSRASETDLNEVFTLGAFRNEYIYSPDGISNIPQAIIDDLVLNSAYAAQIGLTDPTAVTRSVLEQIYAPWASQDDRYSVTGPDKIAQRRGLITTLEWTQRFTDSLQAKVSINREDNDRESLARDGFSAGRVQSDATGPRAFDPFIQTYWVKQEGRTEANALRSTLLWDVELNTNIPILKDSEHKLLFGFDWDQLKRSPKIYEQISDPASLRDGRFFQGNDLLNERFYLSDGFGPGTPNIGFNNRDDLFVLRSENEFDAQTSGSWFAAQSSFLNGRLRTLLGLRYDNINIDYSLQDYKFGVADPFVINNLGGDYSRAVTQIDDASRSFEQVSPSAGALFWVTNEVAVFANYAQSIQSPTNIQVDPLGELIPPVYGEGYEYGIRFDLFDRKLTGQVTAFYIEKENDNIVNYDFRLQDIFTFAEFGASHPQIFNPNGTLNNNLLPGKQMAGDVSRSEGIEVEFYYNPNRNLSFTLSYAYTNLDAIKINEKVNPRFAQVFGQAPHNLLLIGRYTFTDGALRGLTIGANQSFRSSSIIGEWYIENDTDAPGEGTWHDIKFDPEYTTDAFVTYRTKLGSGRSAPNLNLNLRVNNIFDNTDLINRNKNAFHRNSRQILVSAAMRF